MIVLDGRVLDSIIPVIAGGIRSLPQQAPGGWHGESFQGSVNSQLDVEAKLVGHMSEY
jgi:hypothetical protein